MSELTIQFEGLHVAVDVEGEILQFSATKCPGSTLRTPCPTHYVGDGAKGSEPVRGETSQSPKRTSKAAQIREFVRRVLADGKFHPRRELSQEVREAGLSTANLDGALKTKDFEKNRNIEGPVFRLSRPPVEYDPDELEVAGTLNGATPDA